MATEAGLIVALEARLNKFEKDLKQAGTIADREVKNIENRFSKFAPSFNPAVGTGIGDAFGSNFLKGFIGALSVEALAGGVIKTLKSLEEIGDVAERIGISTDALQTLQFQLDQNGGSAEDATMALTKFSDAIGDAVAGGGKLYELLKLNNVALRDSSGNIRSTDDLLVEFARLVANAESQQVKMSLAVDAFGRRAGPKMLQTLEEIARNGLPSLIAQAKDFGVVVDNDMVKKAQDFADAWAKAGRSAFVSISELVVKALEKANELLGDAFDLLNTLSGGFLRKPGGKTRGDEIDEENMYKGQGVKGGIGFAKGGTTKIPSKAGPKDPIESQFESIQKHIELTKADTEAVGESAGAHERLRVTAALTQAILAADKSPSDYAERIKEIGLAAEDAANKLAARQHTFQEIMSASREISSALADGFKMATLEGKKFDEVLSTIGMRLADAAISKAFDALLVGSSGAGAGGGLISGLLNSIFKAEGGPVQGGKSYVVGEKGPEIFTPASSGVITPNGVKSSSPGPSKFDVNLNLNLSGANGDLTIARIARQEARRGVQQAIAITNAGAPGRQMKFSQLGT